MVPRPPPTRIALVVHPTRQVDAPLEVVQRWAAERGANIVQLHVAGSAERAIAPPGQAEPGDLVVALGGDGTVLSALRASAPVGAPVLGVACGSLGALTAVHADQVERALERVHAGDWTERRLPALAIEPAQAPSAWALNDFVVVRRGAGQLVADVHVDHELYVRLAGDGLIVASPLGSSAYSMAAGGPVIVTGTQAIVCTPLVMHGGNAPPLVVPATSVVSVAVHRRFVGFDVEIDGHAQQIEDMDFRISLHREKVTLVMFGEPGLGLTALRERGLIADSPRVLARDARDRAPR